MRASLATIVLASTLAMPGGPAARAVEDADPAPRTVRVDVIATDKSGRAVENLKPSDFELREDGEAQPLDEARFIRIDRSRAGEPADPIESDADETSAAARADTRLFAVYLDEYHVSASNSE